MRCRWEQEKEQASCYRLSHAVKHTTPFAGRPQKTTAVEGSVWLGKWATAAVQRRPKVRRRGWDFSREERWAVESATTDNSSAPFIWYTPSTCFASCNLVPPQPTQVPKGLGQGEQRSWRTQRSGVVARRRGRRRSRRSWLPWRLSRRRGRPSDRSRYALSIERVNCTWG